MQEYRAEAATLEGFIQQLAVGYLARGYWFYVGGLIPDGKDPRAVDAKLISRYGVAVSKFERARRKARGLANVQYLRYGQRFVLLATAGEHRFFREESGIRDCRVVPIKLGGYAASFRGGHAQVRIERAAWMELKAYYVDRATKRPANWFEMEFRRWPFEPWGPIVRQTFVILNQVNRARKAAGLDPIPTSCVRLKRRIYRPFDEPVAAVGAASVGEGSAIASRCVRASPGGSGGMLGISVRPLNWNGGRRMRDAASGPGGPPSRVESGPTPGAG